MIIVNMVAIERLPEELLPLNFKALITKNKNCRMINEERGGSYISFRFEKEGINGQGKKKSICVNVWRSGAMAISGITALEEGEKAMRKVLTMIEEKE